MEYLDLDLYVMEAQADGTYPVEAHSPLAGDACGRLELPIDDPALQNTLADLAMLRATGNQLVETGRQLFQAVFAGEVGRCYVASRGGLREDQALRVRLRFQDPSLAALPWELLYDDWITLDFLALSLRSPVVRYLAAPVPNAPFAVDGPLRVLLVAAAPNDQRPLDVAGEINRIRSALEVLRSEALVALDCLMGATKDSLQDQLRQGYHVFHFIGHGTFKSEGGLLCLESPGGRSDFLTAQELSTLLADTQVRMAVLNACRTAEPGYLGPAWGVGPRLVRAGIPAVIGMRHKIFDDSAVIFAREFYEAVASGYPPDAALTEARKALMLAMGRNQQDWSLPILFMRALDGYLFNIQSITGGRRYVEMGLVTKINLEEHRRGPHKDLRTILWQVLRSLRPVGINVSIKVEVYLGPTLNMIRPASVAVVDLPVFLWTIGEEMARSCQDVTEELGAPPALTVRVILLDAAEVVWESPQKQIVLSTPVNVVAEAERMHKLACPQDVYNQLTPDRKYYWQLVLTFPSLDFDGRLIEQTICQQASFRVLSRQEQETMSLMLAGLPSEAAEDSSSALLRGAIYEAFGVCDQAASAYERASADNALRDQVYRRLAALYQKRAYELLGLPDEKPASRPIPDFARKANHYAALVASENS